MKKWIRKLKESVWLKPATIGLFSLLLAVLVGLLDSGRYILLENFLPPMLMTSVELSRTILGVIAGALITMTIFTFSTTMVVLTTYSSQFSPRVVKNFLMDENTMRTLGVFLGGFIYSIMTLSYMRNDIHSSYVISAILGILYILICLVYFLRYINHVSSFIQMNNLIDRLQREATQRIEEYLEFIKIGTPKDHEKKADDIGSFAYTLAAGSNGYLQFVDYKGLIKWADENEWFVTIEKIPGSFVTDSTPIMTIHYHNNGGEKDEEWEKKLRSFFEIGKEHSEMQEYMYPIHKIEEIALRAISPGINDPNTAIHCLYIMGLLLSEVSATPSGRLMVETEGKLVAELELVEFKQVLYDVFYQIIHYGKEDLSVMVGLIRSLRIIYESASSENREIIREFVEYLWIKIKPGDKPSFEKEWLNSERSKLNRAEGV